jgi:hypothetical protein
MVSRLREQLEAAKQETDSWPAWRKSEIDAEVAKTPLRRPSERNQSSGESNTKSRASKV